MLAIMRGIRPMTDPGGSSSGGFQSYHADHSIVDLFSVSKKEFIGAVARHHRLIENIPVLRTS